MFQGTIKPADPKLQNSNEISAAIGSVVTGKPGTVKKLKIGKKSVDFLYNEEHGHFHYTVTGDVKQHVAETREELKAALETVLNS